MNIASLSLSAALLAGPCLAQEQITLLSASSPESYDQLGMAVDLAPGQLILGRSASNRPILGGQIPDVGSVTVFEQSGSAWNEVANLFRPGAAQGDQFGRSVDCDGVHLVAGAPHASVGGLFTMTLDAGTVVVFEKNASGLWTVATELVPFEPQVGADYGLSVALEGSRIVIGAPGADFVGAAYVFDKGPSGWTQTAKLIAPGGADRFGQSVALDGGRVLVGAPLTNYVFTLNVGAAFFYEANFAGGAQLVLPSVLNEPQMFGSSVDFEGDLMVVGAPWADGGRGAADVLAPSIFGMWSNVERLVPVNADTSDEYGQTVAMDGGRVLVGRGGNVVVESSIAAALFTLASGTWFETCKLTSSFPGPSLGWAIDMEGDLALTGDPTVAYLESTLDGLGVLWDLDTFKVKDCTDLNPPGSLTISSGQPTIGTTWELALHNPLGTQGPGSAAYLWLASDQAVTADCGLIGADWGMAGSGASGELVVLPTGNPLAGPLPYDGTAPALMSIAVPDEPAFVGLSFIMQGFIVGGGTSSAPVGLSQARKFCVGVPAQ